MQRVLALGLETGTIGHSLRIAGNSVVTVELCGGTMEVELELYDAFRGLPPEIMLVGLSRSPDIQPIRHLRETIREVWGDKIPMPPCLALINRHHLRIPDLPLVADDVLMPPYDVQEALSRISFLLFRFRRIKGGNCISWAGVSLDLDRCTASDCHGRALALTPREFSLLAFLCSHRGRFFSRENLLNLVWGVQFQGYERTVDIHIRRLRAKLPPSASRYLETRRGTGYGLVDPE